MVVRKANQCVIWAFAKSCRPSVQLTFPLALPFLQLKTSPALCFPGSYGSHQANSTKIDRWESASQAVGHQGRSGGREARRRIKVGSGELRVFVDDRGTEQRTRIHQPSNPGGPQISADGRGCEETSSVPAWNGRLAGDSQVPKKHRAPHSEAAIPGASPSALSRPVLPRLFSTL